MSSDMARDRVVELFPLDRCRRFRAQVESYAVHARDLVDDPARDRLEEVVRQARPVCGHRVLRRDRANHDRVGVRPLVALHADRTDRRQHGERLPELAVQTRAPDLLLQDRVRRPQDLEPLRGDLADDPDRKPWAWKRLPPDHPLRHPELLADTSYLVLEQQTQRLDELHAHVRREAADVVVRLDLRRDAVLRPAGLDHVGVERPLDEKANVPELPRLLLEDADELLADDLPLLLGIVDTLETREESLL